MSCYYHPHREKKPCKLQAGSCILLTLISVCVRVFYNLYVDEYALRKMLLLVFYQTEKVICHPYMIPSWSHHKPNITPLWSPDHPPSLHITPLWSPHHPTSPPLSSPHHLPVVQHFPYWYPPPFKMKVIGFPYWYPPPFKRKVTGQKLDICKKNLLTI